MLQLLKRDAQADDSAPEIVVHNGEDACASVREPFEIHMKLIVNAQQRSVVEDWARYLYRVLDPLEPLANKCMRKQICRQARIDFVAALEEGPVGHLLQTVLQKR